MAKNNNIIPFLDELFGVDAPKIRAKTFKTLRKASLIYRKLKTQRNRIIIELYKKGQTMQKVADICEVCSHTVFRVLKLNKIKTRSIYNNAKKIAKRNTVIIELYKGGKTMKKIADMYTLKQSSISVILKNNNVKTRYEKTKPKL